MTKISAAVSRCPLLTGCECYQQSIQQYNQYTISIEVFKSEVQSIYIYMCSIYLYILELTKYKEFHLINELWLIRINHN